LIFWRFGGMHAGDTCFFGMEFLYFGGMQWSGLANDFDDVAIVVVVGQEGNCFSKSSMSYLKAFD
jgi:hypothetical protein